ncbi:MAG: metal-dependent transcriptional regulator [Saprospiraceae bacterium]|nr:metal-dependent transcriptional regulator [Saprospiraceae bacterium]
MPTQTKENYLKAIYLLEQNKLKVTITAIGKEMGVSKPTVNNMIKKLDQNGWINYEKYKPIQLTDQGKLTAALIVRKHRLTEMFLVNVMGFGWEEVHQIAEEMEHLKSEALFDRMDELLGYPTNDPHGSPIPDKKGEYNRKTYVKLSSIQPGKKAILKAVGDSSVLLLTMLNEKAITLGTIFEIHKIEEFDHSMIVDYEENKSVMLSHEVCKRLLVDEVR